MKLVSTKINENSGIEFDIYEIENKFQISLNGSLQIFQFNSLNEAEEYIESISLLKG